MTNEKLKTIDASESRHNAYQEAAKVDAIINDLITKYPIESNFLFWKIFCRTVRTSIELIDSMAAYKP